MKVQFENVETLTKEQKIKINKLESNNSDQLKLIAEKETIITGAIVDLKKVRTECKA